MLTTFKSKFVPYAPLILRLGLAVVFLWSGVSKLASPEGAVGVCTNRAEAIDVVSTLAWVPFDPEFIVIVQSVVELALGGLLLVGLWLPLAALVSTLMFLAFFVIFDFNLVWKNVGLLAAALALFGSEADRFSLDSFLARRRLK